MCSSRTCRRDVAILALLLCLSLALGPSTATAGLINPARNLVPDISAFDLVANYDASSGLLSITGCPQYYSAPVAGDSNFVTAADDYSLSINATLNPASTTPMSATGSISLYGSVTGGTSTLLLAGTVDQVGSDLHEAEGYLLMDIAFHVTGGSLAGAFGPAGATGITLYYNSDWGDTAFTGSFSSDFSYNDICNNVADTFSITTPEPGTLALLLTSIGGLAVSAWRRSRTRRS